MVSPVQTQRSPRSALLRSNEGRKRRSDGPDGRSPVRKAGRKLSFVKEPEDSGHFTAEEEGLKENDEEGEEEEEEEEDEETVAKLKKSSLHDYRTVVVEHAQLTTSRLFSEGHVATGEFPYDHARFAEDAKKFNEKGRWQKQPSGPSTLHNDIVVEEEFPSFNPFLRRVGKLCKSRRSTTSMFLKQRLQQNVKSGRRHRDGRNGPFRICGVAYDPDAPVDFKQLDIGMVDAEKARGGKAVNQWQIREDGTADVKRIQLKSGAYHIMDAVASSNSHAHHEVLIREDLLQRHGAVTTFVVDCDPIKPETFFADVAQAAVEAKEEVGLADGVSAYVPPPEQDQIKTSCFAEQSRAWHKLQFETNNENYIRQQTEGAQTWHEKDGKMVAPGTEGAVKRATGGASKKGKIGGKIGGAMTQGRICNQVGARENENKADLERINIPATTGDVEGGEGGNILGSPKTLRARGLCFGHTAAGPGLAAQIKASINLETGEILQGVSLCNTPEFEEPGLTRGLSTWKLDENCDLVLGYHNGNISDKHPVCFVGGTVPAIQVGEEWLVARFALQYIKEGRIVSRVGNNKRHNGADKRYRKKKLTKN